MTSRPRLVVLSALIASLVLALAGRLAYLQLGGAGGYARAAAENTTRQIVTPPVRGQILDAAGRALVRNRTALVVSVDRLALARGPGGSTGVLRRLAEVLDTPYERLAQRIRLCTRGVRRPCWPGSPYQPIPVEERVDSRAALRILERREDFPGVSATLTPVRDHPLRGAAAQLLGYLQPITQEELDARGMAARVATTGDSSVDLIGRGGLEAAYDDRLRGTAGLRTVAVDSAGKVLRVLGERPARPGDHLVTSIDAGVQEATEAAIREAVQTARGRGMPSDGAAGVVLDARTGRVIAMASHPSYDPRVWTGGISQREYDRLLSPRQGRPLISRALQGQWPPGSTWKVTSTAAAAVDGYELDAIYDCPGAFTVGNRKFHNFDATPLGRMNMHRALVVSCDTIFYRFAYEMWQRDGGTRPVHRPRDPMQRMARGFGFGVPTGIDLPGEAAGRIADRQWKRAFWAANREENCRRARTGYPELMRTRPREARYLRALAVENCAEGHMWRPGDAANFSIGQGDVLVTPLQLARAYAAIANGGTLFHPRVGKALVRPDGTVVRRLTPSVAGRLPVPASTLAYIKRALAEVPRTGTAAGAFQGFPLDRVAVAGKTGTSEVYGKKDTSWFASYAPADDPRFVVVVVVSQAGTGADVSAPAVRRIYEAIYGLNGRPAAFPDGRPPDRLPVVRPDGVVEAAPMPGTREPAGRPAGERAGRPGDESRREPPAGPGREPAGRDGRR